MDRRQPAPPVVSQSAELEWENSALPSICDTAERMLLTLVTEAAEFYERQRHKLRFTGCTDSGTSIGTKTRLGHSAWTLGKSVLNRTTDASCVCMCMRFLFNFESVLL